MNWIIAALFSAFFAGITSILAKCAVRKTDSDIATAIRTVVVLVFSWIMVLSVGSQNTLTQIETKSFIFLILSGIATGASWICYFKALSLGDVNKVVPIDKSSTVLTVILAIILFGETENLAIKLVCTAALLIGTLLMIEKKEGQTAHQNKKWLIYAIFAAIFASLTSILSKMGITGVESNLGTAIRTFIVLIMAWVVVFLKGKQKAIKKINKKELLFICLSGIATGASWLCYYYAIQNGIVSVVVPIDKMSVLISIVFSYFVFKEKLSVRAAVGLVILSFATLSLAIWG